MKELQGFQRKYLRGLANTIKPNVYVGKNGLTDDVISAINAELDDHELIKVKFQDYKDYRKELTAEIAEKTQSAIAGIIGHVAILYRESNNPEKRCIKLPE